MVDEEEIAHMKRTIEHLQRSLAQTDETIDLIFSKFDLQNGTNTRIENDWIPHLESRLDRIDKKLDELSEKVEPMFDVIFPRQGEMKDDVERIIASQKRGKGDGDSKV